jgi:hypothetical protein
MTKKHALHAQRMIKILEILSTNPEYRKDCPMPTRMFQRGYNFYKFPKHYNNKDLTAKKARDNYCSKICYGLLDIKYEGRCPCHQFGIKEAIKRTWIALEEKGYLE